MSLEWRDWCRLCASCDGSDVSLFEKQDMTLQDKIVKYLSISVDKDDELPKSVCQSCSQRLFTFDHYAEQCLRVQAMFGALLEEGDENDTKLGLIREEFLQEVDDKDKVEVEHIDSKISIEMFSIAEDEFASSDSITNVRRVKPKVSRKQPARKKNTKTSSRRTRSTITNSTSKRKGEQECELRSSTRLQEIAQHQRETTTAIVKVEVEDPPEEEEESKKDAKEKKEDREHKDDFEAQPGSKKRSRSSKTLVGAAKRKAKVPRVVKRKQDDESDNKEEALSDEGCEDSIIDIHDSNDTEDSKAVEKESDEKELNPQPSIFKWECHVCGEVCRNWYCLSIHCRQLHKVPAQVVCLCAKVLASRTSIIKHRLKHTNAYKYRCDKCEKAFHRKALLDLHILSHVPKEEQPFVCCKCARRFHSEALLRQHERVHLPKEERLIYPCSICNKKFSSKAAVSYHLKAVHSGERPFVCDQCGHSFTSKGILQEHLTIHSDETPFKCAQCRKSFKTKYRLKIHMDTHRETPYQCPVCPLQLSTRRTLRMHLVVHRDTKAYQCAVCGKAFRRAKDLKNHHNLHTGRRPYTCTFCPRTFANGSNCRAHKRKMHPEELRMYEAALAAAENENLGGPAAPQPSSTSASTLPTSTSTDHSTSNSNAGPQPTTASNPPPPPPTLLPSQLKPGTSLTNELGPISHSELGKHSIFDSSLSSNSSTKKFLSGSQMFQTSAEHPHQTPKYPNSSHLDLSEDGLGTMGEHMVPHSVNVSGSSSMMTMAMVRMVDSHQSRSIQNMSLAHDISSESRNISAMNLNSSRRNMTSGDSLLNTSHLASLTPLNLNVSEMHSNRHHQHLNESPTLSEIEESNFMSVSRRPVDNFTNARSHIPNLNSNIQIHRQQQHQSLTSLSRSLVEREISASSNLNRMHHSQHHGGSGELQGYTSLNHLYQHHGESMPSAVAAAIAHSGSMGVPAFPGNPYIHHNMGYNRGNTNM